MKKSNFISSSSYFFFFILWKLFEYWNCLINQSWFQLKCTSLMVVLHPSTITRANCKNLILVSSLFPLSIRNNLVLLNEKLLVIKHFKQVLHVAAFSDVNNGFDLGRQCNCLTATLYYISRSDQTTIHNPYQGWSKSR